MGNIRDFLVSAEELPSPKGTALRLLEVARNPNASLNDAVKVVRSDPALAGFVLRAANAARFGRSPVALDLQQALFRLGLDVVRSYAMTLSMMSARPQALCQGFDYKLFWMRSLATGVAMEQLSQYMDGLPGAEAFSLGLLADIGRLAFATSAPAAYADVAKRLAEGATDEELAALERVTFGFDHHELSAVLLADWGIPTSMADVVYWQCDPEGGGFAPSSRQYRLASALQLASLLSVCLVERPGNVEEETSALFLRAAISGLAAERVREWARQSFNEFHQWAALVGMGKLASVRLPESLRPVARV